jgi:hypothetical protein
VCGLNHAKPHYNDFVQAFEAWVPHFRAAALPTPVSIFLLSGAYKEGIKRIDRNDDLPSAASQRTPQAKQPEKNHRKNMDAPKDTNDEKLVYDTIGGKVRPLHRKDLVIKTSPETPCYVMQTLNISGIDVLTFYDSGANNNLVNNRVALEAGFRLLSRNVIRFGVAGGGTVDSDCGQYAAILGPDRNGDYHDVECQGVDTITGVFPRFDLIPLHEMAARYLPGHGPNLPPEIGGDEVKLMIGIRSTQLAPKLVLTLPGGLCVYQSVFADIWRSDYCFGGPHAIFTEAYNKARDVRHAGVAQVIFSELAMAYLESPRTFLTEKQYTGCERDACEAIESAVSPSEPDCDKFTTEELELVSEVVPTAPPSEGSSEDHFPTCLHFLECNDDKFVTKELEPVSEVVPTAPPREGSSEDHLPTGLRFLECNEPDINCFEPSAPCSGAPKDPQLQVGGAGQMSALSRPVKRADNQPTSKPTSAHECSALLQDEALPTSGGCAVNKPSIASDGGCGDGPHLQRPVAFSCWPAVVETPESKAASALKSFSFKSSVHCPGNPMNPQLQVGDARQMLAPSWPSKTDSSKPDSDIGQHSKGEDTQSANKQGSPSGCHSNQVDCNTGNDTDDSDVKQATRLRQRRQTRAVRQWKQRVKAAEKRKRAAAAARAKAATREKEVSFLASQFRMLATNINRFVKTALKAVKARPPYSNAGRRAPQLHATRNTNLNPVIRTGLLLLKSLQKPGSATNSPAPASEAATSNQTSSLEKPVMLERSTTTASVTPESPAEQLSRIRTETVGVQAEEVRSCTVLETSDPHLHVRPASEAHSSPSVSTGGVLLIAQDNASDFAITPAPVAVIAIARSFEIAASISAPKFVPLPPVDDEGWSGVEHKPDKTSADGRTVGGGQDMAGLSGSPVEGGRGGREFLPARRKLLAPTLALPDY